MDIGTDSPIIGWPHLPGWVVMWSMAFGIYLFLKSTSWLARKKVEVASWKQAAYLIGWPGMDVDTFLNPREIDLPRPRFQEWAFAVLKLVFGIALLAAGGQFRVSVDQYVTGWVEMIGLAFILHFGLFHILSLVWRTCGLQADPIMDWPIASQSLAEFWGRRWNRAFRDLTHRFLFRPLIRPLGPSGSLVVGFLMSGLVHDVVISLPAAGGFGGPTAFFAIQAVGILFERSHFGRLAGFGRGIIGRVFCLAFLLLPVGLLFHHSFVCKIIVPFVHAIRSVL